LSEKSSITDDQLDIQDVKDELFRLSKAIEDKDIDLIDLILAKLRSFPLSSKTNDTIVELADLILEADFEQAQSKILPLITR
jgi:L-ribulose-5-phosphate 3-epimerase UlaE